MDENILIMLSGTRMAGVVHPGTRLTRYIYDELSSLSYPAPCSPVVDVNSLDPKISKTLNWYRLLPVFLGVILLVQAGSAYVYHFQVDQSVSPQEIQLGDSVTMKFHVYDRENGVGFAGAPVTISLYRTIPAGQVRIDLVTTNASGWATYSYTPQEAARFAFTSYSSVNYSTYPGFPPVGMQSSVGDPPGSYFNVTAKPLILGFTLKPVDPIVLVTTTTTTAPPFTVTQTARQTTPLTQVTQSTQVTQATQVPQTTSAVPASQSDTTPPVTTLTLTATEDGNGGSISGVICTLTAADNPGGSGVSVIQYSYDGTSWNTYRQPFPPDKTGPVVLYYRSSDNAGNTEVAKVKAIAISSPGAPPAGTPASPAPVPAPAATTSADAIPFFPLPLWLVALIIFVLIVAIGGGLYLKSRLREEQKK